MKSERRVVRSAPFPFSPLPPFPSSPPLFSRSPSGPLDVFCAACVCAARAALTLAWRFAGGEVKCGVGVGGGGAVAVEICAVVLARVGGGWVGGGLGAVVRDGLDCWRGVGEGFLMDGVGGGVMGGGLLVVVEEEGSGC